MHLFRSPQTIVTGVGSLRSVPQHVVRHGASKVMIFVDPALVKAGSLAKLTQILEQEGIPYVVYSDIVPEPPIDIADEAVHALRQSGADIVIGMGGGSCLDMAKAAAVLSVQDGSVAHYLNLTGQNNVGDKGLPKLLIPTTAGTGSEVTDIAVFSVDTTKDVITDPYLLADVAIVDPELTLSLPPRVTAATGVDALTHAVEAFISVQATPLTDTLALEAISRISQNIRTAVWHGANVSAREQMAWGSLLAGLSFYNAGVSGVHALAYPLGGLFKMSHGEANAVLLPYVFDFVWPACVEKMGVLARTLGVRTDGLTPRTAACMAVKELSNIVRDVGLPRTVRHYGIGEQDIQLLAVEAAKQTRLLSRSPRPYTLNDIQAIYQAAYDGRLGERER